MPKLKEPTPLQKAALDVLFENVLQTCIRLRQTAGCLDELRQAISIIRKEMCSQLPSSLLSDFCHKFIEDDRNSDDPKFYAFPEIMWDMEIVGLKFNNKTVRYLGTDNLDRYLRWDELDFRRLSLTNFYVDLKKLHLDHLVTFIDPHSCRDSTLNIIGRSCPKLQILRIDCSKKVTDEGLSALSLCTDLRSVNVFQCSVSYNGQNLFLSMHKKIEEFVFSDGLLPHLDSTVLPNMEHLIMNLKHRVTSANLRSALAKFPNLTHVEINWEIPEDLSMLESLDKLEVISIYCLPKMHPERTRAMWESMQELLRIIGANITTLSLTCWIFDYFLRQEGIDFIYKHCPNIENLTFNHGEGLIVVPPFRKLKKLDSIIPVQYDYLGRPIEPTLQFGKLLELERMFFHNFDNSLEAIKSIMFDHEIFPKLSFVETYIKDDSHLDEINRTARINNLDFKAINTTRPTWMIKSSPALNAELLYL